MKRMTLLVIAAACGTVGASHASAQNGYDQGNTITCSSDDGSRHYCDANTSGGRVQMVRQRSDARCTQGYSYGYDQRGIWVDHGCRADFAVSGGNWNNGNNGYGNWNGRNRNSGDWRGNTSDAVDSVTCGSDDGKRHYCNADTSGRVTLAHKRSDAKCTLGYSWGYDQQGIWVDHGCRADFSVESRNGNGYRR